MCQFAYGIFSCPDNTQTMKILTLPAFVQFVNMHLSFLRDSYSLGIEDVQFGTFSISNLIKKYSDYAMAVYNSQLIIESFPKIVNGQPVFPNFNSINKFKRQMILTVLNNVKTWPYYDVSNIPPEPLNIDYIIYYTASEFLPKVYSGSFVDLPTTSPIATLDKITYIQNNTTNTYPGLGSLSLSYINPDITTPYYGPTKPCAKCPSIVMSNLSNGNVMRQAFVNYDSVAAVYGVNYLFEDGSTNPGGYIPTNYKSSTTFNYKIIPPYHPNNDKNVLYYLTYVQPSSTDGYYFIANDIIFGFSFNNTY